MTATATDYDEIVRVVQLYIDGFNDCDIEKFKQAFHENAWIFFYGWSGSGTRRASSYAALISAKRCLIASSLLSKR
jgi:Putative lumazine-binding